MIHHPPSFLESLDTALPTEQERVTVRSDVEHAGGERTRIEGMGRIGSL
jgi:hypothetical protein